MPDSFETYLPWFLLREIPLLGNATFKKLIDHFQTPENILASSKEQLASIDKISSKVVAGILNSQQFLDPAKKELECIFKSNIRIVTLNDKDYPPLLRQIGDPPPILTYKGSLDLSSPCISVIGSRAATSYGLSTAFNLSYKLASKGFQVVSGLARGIDAKAHEGTLKAGGRTIAVLGSGLNRIYPRENRRLFQSIAGNGTIFSEFKVNTEPLAPHFPMRNRIIAGLSCGSIVVEAAKRSGSLITARLSAEYNREVFAVPGSISSKKSQGTHALLKQGAKLVESEMDIIDELHHFIHPASVDRKTKKTHTKPLQKENLTQYKKNTPDEDIIMQFIEPYPVHIDELIEKTRMDASNVSSILFDLEMKQKVIHHQGNYYSITEEYH